MNTQYLSIKRKRNLIPTLFKQQNNLSSNELHYITQPYYIIKIFNFFAKNLRSEN